MAVPPPEEWFAFATRGGWLYAAIALLASWYVGNLLVRVLGRSVSRRFGRPSVSRTVLRVIKTSALLVGVLIALRLIGLPISSIALSVTVFSAVLGLVLAPIIGSVINGLFVLADQPYEIGDMIELIDTGQQGFVEDITLRYTKIFTLQNTFLVIPNSTIRERDVTNYSAEDERTRAALSVGVTYEGDLDAARRLMEETAASVPQVIGGGPDIRIGSARYPAAPTCQIEAFGDHGVHLRLRYWVTQPYRLKTVQSDVHEAIWERIEENPDVEIAYPHQHHIFDETSGTATVSLEGEDQT